MPDISFTYLHICVRLIKIYLYLANWVSSAKQYSNINAVYITLDRKHKYRNQFKKQCKSIKD